MTKAPDELYFGVTEFSSSPDVQLPLASSSSTWASRIIDSEVCGFYQWMKSFQWIVNLDNKIAVWVAIIVFEYDRYYQIKQNGKSNVRHTMCQMNIDQLDARACAVSQANLSIRDTGASWIIFLKE